MAKQSRAGQVNAQVMLVGKKGNLAQAGPITAENVQQYMAEPTSVKRVRTFLEEHGFEISGVGPFSISVVASPQRFEQVFGSRPRKVSARRSAGNASWTWSGKPVVPTELEGEVAAVVLPQPTALG